HAACTLRLGRPCRAMVPGMRPTLALGNGAARADPNHVTLAAAVPLVVDMVLLRTANKLLVQRVHPPPLHKNGGRLVGLVRHDDSLQHATRHETLLLLSDLRALRA